MSRLNDPVARKVAQAVQHYVTTSMDLAPLPEGATVEAHPVGLDTTGITVTTTGQGVRYILVQVSEFDHPR